MGTRGFLGFVGNGKTVITYNHFDSYPDCLGMNTLAWLREVTDVEVIKILVDHMIPVDDKTPPTKEQLAALEEFSDYGVCGNPAVQPNWYQALRKTQGDAQAILVSGYYEDASEFPYDSLFCEWGYLIDLDSSTFEVYEGFQKERHTMGRFAQDGPDQKLDGGSADYYPVRLVAAWKLDALPTDAEFGLALARNGETGEVVNPLARGIVQAVVLAGGGQI